MVTNKKNIDKVGILLGSIKNTKEIFDNDGYMIMDDGSKEKINAITTIADILQIVKGKNIKAGLISQKHIHPEWQLFLVQNGEVILHYKPFLRWKKKVLKEGEFYTVRGGIPHYNTFVKETNLISILIPANPYFPVVKKRG